jgi:multiple sugar transport system ATP-binding protein
VVGAEGQAVVYGVRPEHLTLSAHGVPATVAVVEPTGSEIQVLGKIDGQDISAIFRERHKFAPGHGIELTPMLDHVHLFDAATGAHL